jgi:hypothetical protein
MQLEQLQQNTQRMETVFDCFTQQHFPHYQDSLIIAGLHTGRK